MVTTGGPIEADDERTSTLAAHGTARIMLRIDGRRPLSSESVAAVDLACDRAEDLAEPGRVIVQVSGSPDPGWSDGLTVGLISKWERVVRRLERLPTATIALAQGDCGGLALDVLLATDYRIAATGARLLIAMDAGIPWPGMALYRLSGPGAQIAAIRRMVLFGVPLPAADASALQLIDELTDDLEAAAATAGDALALEAGTELAIRRQLMLDASSIGFDEALGAHLAACDRLLRRRPGPAA